MPKASIAARPVIFQTLAVAPMSARISASGMPEVVMLPRFNETRGPVGVAVGLANELFETFGYASLHDASPEKMLTRKASTVAEIFRCPIRFRGKCTLVSGWRFGLALRVGASGRRFGLALRVGASGFTPVLRRLLMC